MMLNGFARLLALKAFTKAEDRRIPVEHRYKIATWASYFLYALGWGLALLGRLYGFEIGAGE